MSSLLRIGKQRSQMCGLTRLHVRPTLVLNVGLSNYVFVCQLATSHRQYYMCLAILNTSVVPICDEADSGNLNNGTGMRGDLG
jgi:hypothetical protein